MSAWIVITAAHLDDYLLAQQAAAIRTLALADGQADRFSPLMQDRCNYVRNRISKRLQISLTPYAVPPELKTCACLLIIEAMQAGFPVLKLSEDQKTMIARAYKALDIAATDDLPISIPDDPINPVVQATGGIEQATTPDRNVYRRKLRGL